MVEFAVESNLSADTMRDTLVSNQLLAKPICFVLQLGIIFAFGCSALIKQLEEIGESTLLNDLSPEDKAKLKSELVGFTSQKARVCICMLHVCIHFSSCAGLFDA